MIISSNKKAFTLTELMIVSAMMAVLLVATMAGFILVKQIFAVNIAQTMFQRTYHLSTDKTKIYYADTARNNIIIYTAPSGAVINLTFGTLNVGAPLCVSIYVSVSQTINHKTVLGALQSSVYLRNHPS